MTEYEKLVEHLFEKADELDMLEDMTIDKEKAAEFRGAAQAFREIAGFLKYLSDDDGA